MLNNLATVEEKRGYLFTEMIETYPSIANENRIALMNVIGTFSELEVDELLESIDKYGMEGTMKKAYDEFLEHPENFNFS